MASFTMKSIFCAAALAVTSAKAAALSPHPRDMTFLPRRAANESTSGWPYGPYSTDGRDIVNSKGDAVTWTGVNWPGSGTLNFPRESNTSLTYFLGETMVPEGLEWQSVDEIVDRIASIGFNFVRL
jgi:endoglucanase